LSNRDELSFLAPPGEVADWRLVAAFDAAAEVGLFEELPATPKEAVTRLGLDERAVRILLGALSVWGVVEEFDGSYSMRPDQLIRTRQRPCATTLKSSAPGVPSSATGYGEPLLPPSRCPRNAAGAGSKRWPKEPATVLLSPWRPAFSASRMLAASWTSEEVTANTLVPSPNEVSR